jgi:hypothetical protein
MTDKKNHQPHGRGGVLIHHQPKCKAISKRTGQPCQGVAMKNGCCWAHGGKSTGPKKPHIKHGYATKAAKA